MDKVEMILKEIEQLTAKFMSFEGLYQDCDALLKLKLNRYCQMVGRESEMTGPVDEEQEKKLERRLKFQEDALKHVYKLLEGDAAKST